MNCRQIVKEEEILEAILDYLVSHKGHIAKINSRIVAKSIAKNKKILESEDLIDCLSRRVKQVLRNLYKNNQDLFFSDDIVYVKKAKSRLIKLLTENF
jgi:ribosomal protein L22